MSQNNDVQQKFKSIVNKLPEDKKRALYKRLKDMDPDTRNKTIEAIVEKDRESRANDAKASSANTNKKTGAPRPEARPEARPQGKKPAKPAAKKGQKPQNGKNIQAGKKPQTAHKQPEMSASKPAQRQDAKQNRQAKAAKPSQDKQVPKKPVDKKQVNRKPVQKKPEPQKIVEEKVPEEKIIEEKIDTPKKPKNKGKIIALAASLTCVAALGVLGYIYRDNIMKLVFPANAAETAASTDSTTTAPSGDITSVTTDTQNTSAPTATPSPVPSAVPVSSDAPNLKGMTIVLDPGHQKLTSSRVEKVASWMAAEKSRCTSGGVGVTTGITEYELTLDFCMKLKSYLEQCGANVIMTRSENDVDLSNQERANMATSSNCNLFLRIHADSANDSKTTGIQMYVPSQGKNFKTDMSKANALGSSLSETTGLNYNGTLSTEVYTGLNYATSVHAVQVSLGYLSNSDDESIITNDEMQYNMVKCFAKFCAEFK